MDTRKNIHVLGAVAIIALFPGCSTDATTFQTNNIGDRSGSRASRTLALAGIAPQFLETIHFDYPPERVQPNTPGPKDLAVSDFTGKVEVLDSNYALEQIISDPTTCPDGGFYDTRGRLYDADYCGAAVTEYKANGTLLFTYTAAGMNYPVDVTTDRTNHVYVVDYGAYSPSIVVEFPQGSSTPLASCSTGLAGEGVAVDTNGAVFVTGNDTTTGSGKLLEYRNGLIGCPTPTTHGVTFGFAGALQIDDAHNLVACDQNVGVYIIPPPYNSISSTIGGAVDAFHVALNRTNGKIFIADAGGAVVLVDYYPSGKPFIVLGTANGLTDPLSVATNPYPQ
jgi:hypothetical protein